MDYATFLASKALLDPQSGLPEPPAICSALFPFQADIVRWALRRGRAGVFAGTGLGKTLMELAWGDAVHRATHGDVLLLTPLAVSAQHLREAARFGVPARHVREQAECGPGINVTNYQKLAHFDLSQFTGVILDESSILKSTDGHYRTHLIQACRQIPFRLAATATPAPNDFMELGNHAEFLGVMSYTDMLATFFVHDGGETRKWRLKGHAENDFWKWMASWSVMLRKPSDLGYEDGAYALPPLLRHQHTVVAEHDPAATGMLFPMEARTMRERLTARRVTVGERVELAAAIVTSSYAAKLTECLGSQNTKPIDAQRLSAALNMLQSYRDSEVERRRQTESTCAPTIRRTKKNGSKHLKTESAKTRSGVRSTYLGSDSGALAKAETSTSIVEETARCVPCSGSASPSTTQYSQPKAAFALSAQPAAPTRGDTGSTLITATTPAGSEDCYVEPATSVSANSKTTETLSREQLSISARLILDPWVIWCQLNDEQRALELAFGELAISINGSHSEDEKERLHESWLAGNAPILIVKPSMFGHGCNWQRCSNTIFVGLNDSWEQVYQAVRRFWRFGQTQTVNAHFIAAETEGAVVANIRRKEADADRMADAMVAHMADLGAAAVRGAVRDRPTYAPEQALILPSWFGAAA